MTYTYDAYGSLSVTKQVDGGPVGGSQLTQVFDLQVNCDNGFSQAFTLTHGQTETFSAIPHGAECTVSENAPTTSPPNYTYGSAQFSEAQPMTISDGSTVVLTVTNPLTLNTGNLSVTKQVDGGPVGGSQLTQVFDLQVSCDNGFSQAFTLTHGQTETFSGIPHGAECTVSENAPTTSPPNYTYGSAQFSEAQPMIIGGGATVSVTVTNPLHQEEAPRITLNADASCVDDVAIVSYQVIPYEFSPTGSPVTLIWSSPATGQVLAEYELTGLPMQGAEPILWPGMVVDAEGSAVGWPGWELDGYTWNQLDDGLVPQLTLTAKIGNLSDTKLLSYPSLGDECAPELASLGDIVWHDEDRDGTQDPDEPGVPDVRVELFASGGELVGVRRTDSTGFFLFDNLRPGSYYLVFSEIPDGFVFTVDNQGDDAIDSDPDPETGRTPQEAVLSAGDDDRTWQAGIYTESDDGSGPPLDPDRENSPTEIPTLGEWALHLMVSLLMLLGAIQVRNVRRQ